jgi:hypothetical protein
MTPARHWYQTRPSDHLAAERSWRFSAIQPMEQPRRSIWQLLVPRREGRK